MKDIAELRQRLEDTKEGETICLDHEDVTLILKQFVYMKKGLMQIPPIKMNSRLDKVAVITENGKARRVFIGGKEMHGVTKLHMKYGVDKLPVISIDFTADEVTLHLEDKK